MKKRTIKIDKQFNNELEIALDKYDKFEKRISESIVASKSEFVNKSERFKKKASLIQNK